MIDWTILAAVKILKFAVFGAMSLASFVADLGGCTAEQSACLDTTATVTAVVMQHPTGATWSVEDPVVPVAPCAPETIHVASKLERIGRLAPPVRVEITFTPDLLTPPTRDPSL